MSEKTERAPRTGTVLPAAARLTGRNVLDIAAWALLGAVLACGGDPAPPTQPEPERAPANSRAARRDRGPAIERILLEPVHPRVGQSLALEVTTRGEGAEKPGVEIEWFVNRASYRSGRGNTLDTARLNGGDSIYALVRLQGANPPVQKQTQTVVLRGPPPEIEELKIEPSPPLASETIRASTQVDAAEQANVVVTYEWSVDGEILPNERGGTLPAGTVRRGQKLRVRALPRDELGEGEWAESSAVVVGNSKPQIDSQPTLDLPEGDRNYRYQLQASDPDGDVPLRYLLLEGPSGMEVDFISGLVSWSVPEDASGRMPVEIAVQDSYGGRGTQRYELTLEWTEVPANDVKGSPADSPEDERAREEQ